MDENPQKRRTHRRRERALHRQSKQFRRRLAATKATCDFSGQTGSFLTLTSPAGMVWTGWAGPQVLGYPGYLEANRVWRVTGEQ